LEVISATTNNDSYVINKNTMVSLRLIYIYIHNYNFACGSMWVLVSNIKGGTETEGVGEQGAEENIWTEER
jgi:hypothetical protein